MRCVTVRLILLEQTGEVCNRKTDPFGARLMMCVTGRLILLEQTDEVCNRKTDPSGTN